MVLKRWRYLDSELSVERGSLFGWLVASPNSTHALTFGAGQCAAQCICLENQPVCGSDGVTYGCPCDAVENGVSYVNGTCGLNCPASSTANTQAGQCACNSGLVCAGATLCFRTSGGDTFATSCSQCSCIAPVTCVDSTMDSNGDCLCAVGATCDSAVAPCGTKSVGGNTRAYYRPASSSASACVGGATAAPTTASGCTADADCANSSLYCSTARTCLPCTRCATFQDSIGGSCPVCPTAAPSASTAAQDPCAAFLTSSSCTVPCAWYGVCRTPTTTTTTTTSTSTTRPTTSTSTTRTTTRTTTTTRTSTTTATFPTSCPFGQFQTAPGASPCTPWQLCTTLTVAPPTATSDRVCGTTPMLNAALPPPSTWYARVTLARVAVGGVIDQRARNAFVAAITQLVLPYQLLSLAFSNIFQTANRRRSLFYTIEYVAQINASLPARALAVLLDNTTATAAALAAAGPQYGTTVFANSNASSAAVRLVDSTGSDPLASGGGGGGGTSSTQDWSTVNTVLIALAGLAVLIAVILLLLYYRRRRKEKAYERIAKAREAQIAAAVPPPQQQIRITSVDETSETPLDMAALMPGRSFRTLGSYRSTPKRESHPVRNQPNRATVWHKGQPGAAARAPTISEKGEEEFDSVRMVAGSARPVARAGATVAPPTARAGPAARAGTAARAQEAAVPYVDVADPAALLRPREALDSYVDVADANALRRSDYSPSDAPYLAIGGDAASRGALALPGHRGSISVVDDDPGLSITENVTRF